MKFIILCSVLLTISGCASTYQGESYGSIATEAFVEGVSPPRGWFDNTWRAVGSIAGHSSR
jgi:hypothetical protein